MLREHDANRARRQEAQAAGGAGDVPAQREREEAPAAGQGGRGRRRGEERRVQGVGQQGPVVLAAALGAARTGAGVVVSGEQRPRRGGGPGRDGKQGRRPWVGREAGEGRRTGEEEAPAAGADGWVAAGRLAERRKKT
jgi:hypothetical protein